MLFPIPFLKYDRFEIVVFQYIEQPDRLIVMPISMPISGKPVSLGQLILPTVATQAARNSP